MYKYFFTYKIATDKDNGIDTNCTVSVEDKLDTADAIERTRLFLLEKFNQEYSSTLGNGKTCLINWFILLEGEK